ncbi:hypothetical protein J120_02305 [candidate division TM6 bacterium JCVI TM6SC1]|uniref:ATP synthase F(0) sector subunit c n=1 Tax=candidate division TM6 bacterium JCVI TM6SC1 TaxID=1306947 RepID=A0A0D2JLC8_9BACT|nr:hypothetical protein J120_02305 [candidate division TM6 bacterium JCVI TM6SC1]
MNGADGIMYAKAAAFIGAAIAMGVGSIGPALGQGMIAAKSCENLGKYPALFSQLRTLNFLSMAIVESSAIYCLIIAGALVGVGYLL